jgi:hypothetical protein
VRFPPLTAIAMEKASKVVSPRLHATLEEAAEGEKWYFFQTESLVLGLVFDYSRLCSPTRNNPGMLLRTSRRFVRHRYFYRHSV